MSAVLIAQKSGEAVKAGPIGLAVILILCIACYFLFKSMSRHMKNVRENFPTELPAKRSIVRSSAPMASVVPTAASERAASERAASERAVSERAASADPGPADDAAAASSGEDAASAGDGASAGDAAQGPSAP